MPIRDFAAGTRQYRLFVIRQGGSVMTFDSLDKLCAHEMRDILSAEKQITKALPKVIEAVTSSELKEALEKHLEETKLQIDRLEKAAELIGISPLRSQHCKGMEGLLEESKEFLEGKGDSGVIDAGLIADCQRVEHYEIAAYGSLCTFLKLLGENEAAELMHQSLEEEKQADSTLTDIAEGFVNLSAEMAPASNRSKRDE
jgi:ferritin-like metal-binding protein YciE